MQGVDERRIYTRLFLLRALPPEIEITKRDRKIIERWIFTKKPEHIWGMTDTIIYEIDQNDTVTNSLYFKNVRIQKSDLITSAEFRETKEMKDKAKIAKCIASKVRVNDMECTFEEYGCSVCALKVESDNVDKLRNFRIPKWLNAERFSIDQICNKKEGELVRFDILYQVELTKNAKKLYAEKNQ